jgi:hypothetical protein
MAKKSKKKVSAKAPTRSAKTKKAITVKSVKARKPATSKPARKVTRRSSADVAKLRKAVLAGSRAKKPADALAKELGISKAYVYALKRKA